MRICSAAARASSSRPWPTMTFHRPARASRYSPPVGVVQQGPQPVRPDMGLILLGGIVQRMDQKGAIAVDFERHCADRRGEDPCNGLSENRLGEGDRPILLRLTAQKWDDPRRCSDRL